MTSSSETQTLYQPHSPIDGVLVALVHERLARQRVRRRRGRGVVHRGEVGVRQAMLVVHRGSRALHVASAVEGFVVLELDREGQIKTY